MGENKGTWGSGIGIYTFTNAELLRDALTHPSADPKNTTAFQRLELIGDAILNMVITDVLLSMFPQEMEGKLSKRRAHLVSKGTCEAISHNLGLASKIHVDMHLNVHKTSILADALEAVIGAVYLDSGRCMDTIRRWILHEWNAQLLEEGSTLVPRTDPKTALQEWTQAHRMHAPVYTEISRQGPDHDITLHVSVAVPGSGAVPCYGSGSTKKAAEKMAAELMLKQMKNGTGAMA